MKAAICIGHSRSGDNGATTPDGLSEWDFNLPVGVRLRDILQARGVEVLLVSRYEGSSYSSAMQWLAGRLNAFDPACAVELHFNAANGTAEGFEYLHWHSSGNGKRLAQSLHDAQQESLGGTSRGIKSKQSGDRGSMFLSLPNAPSVICEPFFGDNPAEANRYAAESTQEALAQSYAAGILEFLGIDIEAPDPPTDDELDRQAILDRLEEIDRQTQSIRSIVST